jgi:hypothetical protein
MESSSSKLNQFKLRYFPLKEDYIYAQVSQNLSSKEYDRAYGKAQIT